MNYTEMSNEELEQLVNQKDGEAICELAERYMYGKKSSDINYTRAYQLLHKGEKMGVTRAFIGLGEMYRNGYRFAKNEEIAREYYMKAGVDYPDDGTATQNIGGAEAPKKTSQIGITALDLKNKLEQAKEARQCENYVAAKQICNEILSIIEGIHQGTIECNDSVDLLELKLEVKWVLAYTAFNEKKYAEMQNHLSENGLLGLHPWGSYLLAVSHQILQTPSVVKEQDLQLLLKVRNNRNLLQFERGDVFTMIGDLVNEGYGMSSGISREAAKEYYQEAMNCGNEYAKEMYNGVTQG